MTKKCPICTSTKGKRSCLLNDHKLICSKCCAQIRNSACEACSYYQESQKFTIEKANKAVKPFTMRFDEEVDIVINGALELIESGNISAGEQILIPLAKKHDDLFSIHFAMGVLYVNKEQYDEAILSFDKAIEIYPYYTDAWFNKALAAQKQADVILMVESLRKVIELGDPDDTVTLQAKDFLNTFAQRCYKDSGVDLDAYIESVKLFNHGFYFMQNEKWQEALLEFEKSSKIDSKSAPTFGNMAICLMKLNENDKAMDFFNKSIEVDSCYEPALINREVLQKKIKENMSADDLDIHNVYYGKDYSIENNKSLISDYLNGNLIPHDTPGKKSWPSKLFNLFFKSH